jgi:hypothetical protein
MGLGNNRDYKSTHDNAMRSLRAHKIIMDRCVADGMSETQASSFAFDIVKTMTKQQKLKIIKFGLDKNPSA